MEEWKNSQLDGKLLYEMSYLSYLIYDYMKYWKIDKLDKLNEFFLNEDSNNNLDVYDKQLLMDLKDKYPEGEILKYFTNSVDFQCVIGKNVHTKRYTIIIRGSESYSDWLYNSFVLKKNVYELFPETSKDEIKSKNIKIHSGFYKMIVTDNIHIQIVEYLKILLEETPDWEIYFTGHSMGSATSTLLSYLMAKTLFKTKITVIALASPKIGNLQFKNDYNNIQNLRLYRICYKKDIVTSYPSFYYHVGHCYHFIKNKWIFFDKTNNIPCKIYNYWNPFDHPCKLYIEAIKEFKH